MNPDRRYPSTQPLVACSWSPHSTQGMYCTGRNTSWNWQVKLELVVVSQRQLTEQIIAEPKVASRIVESDFKLHLRTVEEVRSVHILLAASAKGRSWLQNSHLHQQITDVINHHKIVYTSSNGRLLSLTIVLVVFPSTRLSGFKILYTIPQNICRRETARRSIKTNSFLSVALFIFDSVGYSVLSRSMTSFSCR